MNKIIIGLGNPGKKYEITKHNAGFLVLDEVVKGKGKKWKKQEKFKAAMVEDSQYRFFKPLTYMNNSGQAVSKITSFYRTDPKELVVVHDDVDLPPMEYKLHFGRGSAGHRGVEDIIQKLGTDQFWRVRIGIGRPDNPSYDVEDYVLSDFSDEELKKLKEISHLIFSDIKQC